MSETSNGACWERMAGSVQFVSQRKGDLIIANRYAANVVTIRWSTKKKNRVDASFCGVVPLNVTPAGDVFADTHANDLSGTRVAKGPDVILTDGNQPWAVSDSKKEEDGRLSRMLTERGWINVFDRSSDPKSCRGSCQSKQKTCDVCQMESCKISYSHSVKAQLF